MAVAFQALGPTASNATTASLVMTSPSCLADDILIATILGKDNLSWTAPNASWTKFVEVNNTTAQRLTIAWKRAATGDSAIPYTFVKSSDNNVLAFGCITAWRGCNASATPIDATSPTTSVTASAVDAVDYVSFNPAETDAFVVAAGVYNNDLTTAGAIGGTNPTFANNADVETGAGTDGSIFIYSGASDGAATGGRSHTTTSGTDAINIGALFGLVKSGGAEPAPAGGQPTMIRGQMTPMLAGYSDRPGKWN